MHHEHIVTLNLRQNKKVGDFLASATPHTYERVQYDMSMRTPLGPEWNTSVTHSRMSRPDRAVAAAEVIEPIIMPRAYKRKLSAIDTGLAKFKRRKRIASRRGPLQ